MARRIRIGAKEIGEGCPAFIIAEAGANHNGDLELAKNMIRSAKQIGADCIKFQTFSAEEFCSDRETVFTYRSQGNEVRENMYDMFKRFEFSRDEWVSIMQYCDEQEILFLTTVQDPPNLEMMLELGLKGIKVGSDDFDHLENLVRYADTGLPLMVSKGMADLGEVDRVLTVLQNHTDQLMVLHCVSLYPADPALLNLRQIQTLQSLYPDVIWGFSDHSQGSLMPVVAVTLGARIIEKHFTLDHDLAGPDHWFSADAAEFARMAQDIRAAEAALGSGAVVPAPGEIEMKNIMRRRVVARRDLPAGACLTGDAVAFRRGEQGCFLNNWERIKGLCLRSAKAANEPIDLGDIDFAQADSAVHTKL